MFSRMNTSRVLRFVVTFLDELGVERPLEVLLLVIVEFHLDVTLVQLFISRGQGRLHRLSHCGRHELEGELALLVEEHIVRCSLTTSLD